MHEDQGYKYLSVIFGIKILQNLYFNLITNYSMFKLNYCIFLILHIHFILIL